MENRDFPIAPLPPFDVNSTGFQVEIPDDADELYFFLLFVTDHIMEYTHRVYMEYTHRVYMEYTNLYVEQSFQEILDKLPE